ncbi:MAG TPA: flagellar biosynthetic protein FliO [Phycisphaerae bacterium]|nr:flagellar biosynthetic protein FliO [Phycisphaerae bacterium]HRR86328.1 flagellar biosynthetic protein FliO [Phycisphaerae bacterium]
MTGYMLNSGIPAACLSLVLTGWLSAQQIQPFPDARPSLRIPPQNILEISDEPNEPAAELYSNHAPPATQPVVTTVKAGPAAPVMPQPGLGTRPATTPPEAANHQSAPIARSEFLERRPTANQRESESRDISRGQHGAGLWSARDLWPLLSVLALILILAWIVRKCLPGRNSLTGQGAIEVLSRIPLSSKQSLVLVRMGRRLLLLGVTNDDINTLCAVEDPDQVAMLVGEVASGRPGSITSQFAREFAEESQVYDKRIVEEEEQSVDTGGQVRNLLNKVRGLASRRNVA